MLAYAGQGRMVIAPVHVPSLLDDTRAMARSALPRGGTLGLEVATPGPWIEGDVTQLQQVLMNLIVNAAEALPPADGVVRVAVTVATPGRLGDETEVIAAPDATRPHACIAVSDNGCGIDRRLHVRIFEPFYSSKFAGRGLGLAAVLGTVRAHRGALYLRSDPGGGAQFRVLLPQLATAPPPEAPPPEAPPPAAPPVVERRAGEVLVVDDEEVVRTVVARILARFGYPFALAAGGAEAIAMVTASPTRFAIALVDLTMPATDGVAVLAAIRTQAPTVKVVMTTGYAEADLLQQLGELRPDGFVQKPMDVSVLVRELERVRQG